MACITRARNIASSSEKEFVVPTKSRKQPACRDCGNKLKPVPIKMTRTGRQKGNGWAHKKREHWLPRPHKAVPVLEEGVEYVTA